MWGLRRMKRLTYSEDVDPIRVIHHVEDGLWWAESPDVPRWLAAGGTFEETRQLAEEGVRFALERDDLVVEHFWPVPPDGAPPTAVAVAPGRSRS
jgi:predicted RNase H-like HicB family nuclease